MATSFLGLASEDWQAIAFTPECPPWPFWPAYRWASRSVGYWLDEFFSAKALLETLLNLPLVLPPVVTGYLLLVLFGRRSFLGGFLHNALGIDIAFTWAAAALAGAVMGFPLLVRAVRVAFQGIDPRFALAARLLGRETARRFSDGKFTAGSSWRHRRRRAVFCPRFGRIRGDAALCRQCAGPSCALRATYLLHEQPGEEAEQRLWRLVAAAVVLSCAALAASEYWQRRGAPRDSP